MSQTHRDRYLLEDLLYATRHGGYLLGGLLYVAQCHRCLLGEILYATRHGGYLLTNLLYATRRDRFLLGDLLFATQRNRYLLGDLLYMYLKLAPGHADISLTPSLNDLIAQYLEQLTQHRKILGHAGFPPLNLPEHWIELKLY